MTSGIDNQSEGLLQMNSDRHGNSVGEATGVVVRLYRVEVIPVEPRENEFGRRCGELAAQGLRLGAEIGAVRWKANKVALYLRDPAGEPLSTKSPFAGTFEEVRVLISDGVAPTAFVGGDASAYLSTGQHVKEVFRGLTTLAGRTGEYIELGHAELPIARAQQYLGSQANSLGSRIPLGWSGDRQRFFFAMRDGTICVVSRATLLERTKELAGNGLCFNNVAKLPVLGAKTTAWKLVTGKGETRIEASFQNGSASCEAWVRLDPHDRVIETFPKPAAPPVKAPPLSPSPLNGGRSRTFPVGDPGA